ncbi:MAG: hypothetical protein IJU44_10500 [Kiritimatiellae bacterium]|nr:hypothetical protein [Kiritimatiellia bacterium]
MIEIMTAVSAILAFCGISSLRNFTPLFAFAALARFLPLWENCPEQFLRLAERTPAWMVSGTGLSILGVLAVIELAANWNTTAREFLVSSRLDELFKPIFCALAVMGFLSTEAAEGLNEVLAPAGQVACGGGGLLLATAVPAGRYALVPLCAFATWGFYRFRRLAVGALELLDPEGDLRLAPIAEEVTVALLFTLLLVLPILALILLLLGILGAWLTAGLFKRLEEQNRIPRWLGRRWMEGLSRREIVAVLDRRFLILLAITVVGQMFPLPVVTAFWFVLFAIGNSILVSGVLARQQRGSGGCLLRMLFSYFKWLAFLLAFCFACVPYIGLAVYLPYLLMYLIRRQRFLNHPESSGR